MHAQNFIRRALLTFLFITGLTGTAFAKTYYVDSETGNDQADGLNEVSAWKTLDRASQPEYMPGDRLLFRSGRSWRGSLLLKGSGTVDSPIVISSYGSGSRPALHGDGKTNRDAVRGQPISCALRLFNQEHWRIENLEITNYNPDEEGGLSLNEWEALNVSDFAEAVLPEQHPGGNMLKAGILVQAKGNVGGGVLSGLSFSNLEIHGINGDLDDKDNGGIFFRVYDDGQGNSIRFDNVLFEDNLIRDVDRTGISNRSDFDNREFDQNIDWNPNRNWVFRNNVFRRTGANALIVRVAVSSLMEYNLFDSCSIKGSGNAAFNFNTDDALWQFNEFRYTKANVDDEDAGGVDSDYRSKNTIVQYNYLHNNDFGLLVTGGPGRFNDGTVVRHNLIVNDGGVARKGADGKFAIRVSGSATNTLFYRNTILLGEDFVDTKLILHKRWRTLPDRTVYRDNIVINLARDSYIDLGESTNNEFSGNQYFGRPIEEPDQD